MTPAPPQERTDLKCTCCGREILAQLVGRETIVVRGQRHGRWHTLVIKLDQFYRWCILRTINPRSIQAA